MGNLPAHAFGDRARPRWTGFRRSNCRAVITGRASGRSNQSQAHHPRLANFHRADVGRACPCFLATPRHSADVDLALVQSRAEHGRGGVRTPSAAVPIRGRVDPDHLLAVTRRRGCANVRLGGTRLIFSDARAARCVFQRGHLEQQRVSDRLSGGPGNQWFSRRAYRFPDRLHD